MTIYMPPCSSGLTVSACSITNVFTLGALLFHFFGGYTDNEIEKMYKDNSFFPCNYETWELSEPLYKTALKAVNPNRAERYCSMSAFREAWEANHKQFAAKTRRP